MPELHPHKDQACSILRNSFREDFYVLILNSCVVFKLRFSNVALNELAFAQTLVGYYFADNVGGTTI